MLSFFGNVVVALLVAHTGLVSTRATSSQRDVSGRDASDGAAPVPSVKVKNGTLLGVRSEEYSQDFFLGVPYAQPPVGDLRFRIPASLNSTFAEPKTVTEYAMRCVGAGSDVSSEDCLYLNVVRPSGIDPRARLPVGLYFHGGGLVVDGTNDPFYNLTFIVQNSVAMGKPIVAVTVGYRLSSWGFPSGYEALNEGIANLGFRDQRLALHWVQENIGAFGGDAKRVTIWGESAGAASVMAHLLAYDGRDDGLFRGALIQSGSTSESYNTASAGETAWETLVSNTSCASTLASGQSIPCLRSLPFAELNATISQIGGAYIQIDNDFVTGLPADQISLGKFLRVPFVAGSNTDEGTAFGPGYGVVDTDAEFTAVVKELADFNDTVVAKLEVLYPNDTAVGVPSLQTWNGSYAAIGWGAEFRRVGAIVGDYVMTSSRRRINHAWVKYGVPTYSYRWDITRGGELPYRGATHGSEVPFVFDTQSGLGYGSNPFTAGLDNATIAELKVVGNLISKTWIAFIHDLDPNKHGIANATIWPQYKGKVGQNLVWERNGTHVENDDYREDAIQYLIDVTQTVPY